jgi:hypothetical protein
MGSERPASSGKLESQSARRMARATRALPSTRNGRPQQPIDGKS